MNERDGEADGGDADDALGLVLTGGGARGAHQAGVLSVVLPALAADGIRPRIVTGASAGAINAAGVTSTAHHPPDVQADILERQWRDVVLSSVARPLWQQVPRNLLGWFGEIADVGGLRLTSLLDTAPLGRHLHQAIDWGSLHHNLASGTVERLSILATATHGGRPTAFTEGGGDLPDSPPPAPRFVPARTEPRHLLASAAIPMLFPPLEIVAPDDARGWYHDGSTRLHTPLSPALSLGADRLLVLSATAISPSARPDVTEPPDLADAAVAVLKAMVEDPVRRDVHRLGVVNQYLAGDDGARRYRSDRGRDPYRVVPYGFIAPDDTDDIGELALDLFRRRYSGLAARKGVDLQVLHRLLGGDSPLQGELLSYLLFDRDFMAELIRLGRAAGERWLAGGGWRTNVLDELREPAPSTG
ncbi:MAG: patatin-like phospholipase family protein [Actinomycetota bacterium]|nr:patatin-like phospholipase family protein [Actinomycetota bacterium]